MQQISLGCPGDSKLHDLSIYGLRLGDCATLQWSEVDLISGIILRIPNKTARRNPKPVIVPIHGVLRSILADTTKAKRAGFVLPETAKEYASRPDNIARALKAHFTVNAITATAGKSDDRVRAAVDVGFHSLRHTFVSLCREADAPLAVVEAIVGHSNPAMTRHYTHVSEQAAVKAIAGLPMITGAGEQTTVPVVRTIPVSDILPLAERLDATNWNEVRAALLEKLAAA